MATSLVEAAAAQVQLITRAAERAHVKGYFAVVHQLNPDARSDRHLYSYFAGALTRWARDWCVAHRRYCIVVDIFPGRQGVLDDTLIFKLKIPRRKPLQPIIVALQLMSKKKAKRWAPAEGTGTLIMVPFTDYMEFAGEGREALEVAIAVLDMAHHRAILTARNTEPETEPEKE